MGVDGRPKGSGTVLFESVKDAQTAIDTYNGYEWYGRILEVREDRFAGLSGQGTMRGAMRQQGGRGGSGFSGGFRGRGGPGASRGGFSGNTSNLIDRVERPEIPGKQIMIRNLPWATTNEDLVDLCETTGVVEEAEILTDNGRSRGSGIVQFEKQEHSELAIAKFNGYMYGGRPLDVRFNDRQHVFTPTATKGKAASMET
jgi:RNA recognition motif-containing protein